MVDIKRVSMGVPITVNLEFKYHRNQRGTRSGEKVMCSDPIRRFDYTVVDVVDTWYTLYFSHVLSGSSTVSRLPISPTFVN